MVIHKAVIDVSIRLVVSSYGDDGGIDDAVDNFMSRALQADIPPELYTEGLVDAKPIGTYHKFHEWEEIDG